ncbi:glycosyltransferase [Reyranella sp.]|uniref:glycosyltransferase family 2 protein n=1 Tax=Reyranella sp. TaxID=1929291 RepID=UPI0025E9F982|nr:glycosyltransferase [Reyranella sp.]
MSTDGWQGPTHAFQQAARSLSGMGHDVMVIDASRVGSGALPPLLTAQNRATATRHMLASHRLAMQLAENPPDLVIAPLRGGIAQAPLMARACGEAFAKTRFALWSNVPSRDRLIAGDAEVGDLSPVIGDAMERQCLSLADALIVDDASGPPVTLGESLNQLPHVSCRRVARPPLPGPAADVQEIVLVGTFQRSSGVPEFIEAIEQLDRSGVLGGRLVTFLGPIGDSRYGLSKEWLGQRAARWTFRFRVVPESNREAALVYAGQAGRLAVGISSDGDEIEAIRARCPRHLTHPARPMSDGDLVSGLAAAISSALHDAGQDPLPETEVDWKDLLENILAQPIRAKKTTSVKISVCVLHYDRLPLLERALSSIPETIDGQDVEIIVVDNATPMSGMKDRIEAVAGQRRRLKVLDLKERLPQAAACNLGLAAAEGDVVAFLDDDNFYVRDGLARLAAAASAHDVVVTNLEIFDGHEGAPSSGRLIFLGEAHSAGLFYNFFGDTAMAVRKAAFAPLGCFHEMSCEYPCLDWVSLAKAYGRGLRIGVLQWPAVRYRRDTARADIQAAKLDQAGARALVFNAYRGRFDAEMVARYAQNLELGDL